MKYLPLYKKWSKSGDFPYLCHFFHDHQDTTFELFKPTDENIEEFCLGFAWAGEYEDGKDIHETRKNIIIFMAVMNGEL